MQKPDLGRVVAERTGALAGQQHAQRHPDARRERGRLHGAADGRAARRGDRRRGAGRSASRSISASISARRKMIGSQYSGSPADGHAGHVDEAGGQPSGDLQSGRGQSPSQSGRRRSARRKSVEDRAARDGRTGRPRPCSTARRSTSPPTARSARPIPIALNSGEVGVGRTATAPADDGAEGHDPVRATSCSSLATAARAAGRCRRRSGCTARARRASSSRRSGVMAPTASTCVPGRDVGAAEEGLGRPGHRGDDVGAGDGVGHRRRRSRLDAQAGTARPARTKRSRCSRVGLNTRTARIGRTAATAATWASACLPVPMIGHRGGVGRADQRGGDRRHRGRAQLAEGEGLDHRPQPPVAGVPQQRAAAWRRRPCGPRSWRRPATLRGHAAERVQRVAAVPGHMGLLHRDGLAGRLQSEVGRHGVDGRGEVEGSTTSRSVSQRGSSRSVIVVTPGGSATSGRGASRTRRACGRSGGDRPPPRGRRGARRPAGCETARRSWTRPPGSWPASRCRRRRARLGPRAAR